MPRHGTPSFNTSNRTHGRGKAGYGAGEKIAIKANLNNTNGPWQDRTPELLAPFDPFARPAVDRPGTSAGIIDHHLRFQPVHPGQSLRQDSPCISRRHVCGPHRRGWTSKGRVSNPTRFLSQLKATTPRDSIPTVVEAAYIIDAAVLRAHVSSGVTLCAKNLFGATSINTDWRKNAHDGFHHNGDGSASYSAFTDYLGHKDLGEKPSFLLLMGSMETTTWMVRLIASGNGAIQRCLAEQHFMSFDGVAIDSVGFDFLTSEWPDLPDIANADNYLRESALAHDPPSKTVYDPERDGIRCRSLGVHEHWNNGTDKKYSPQSRKSARDRTLPSLKCGTYLSRRCR